mgnify:CR=1 FL=1
MKSEKYIIGLIYLAIGLFVGGCIITVGFMAQQSTLANSATVDASSPVSTVIDGEVVQGGMAVLDPCVAEPYGACGRELGGVYYPFANLPAVDPRSIIQTRITHYGPPGFTANDVTASGKTISECLQMVSDLSAEWGLPITGFCAVSRSMPWYDNVRDEVPTLIQIQDHGYYLVLDRKGSGDVQGCDIYEPLQDGSAYSHARMVWKIQ